MDTHASMLNLSHQTRARRYLERILQEWTVPAAILLFGAPGTGKNYLALQFARGYLCLEQQFGGCGHCPACVQMQALRHPDLLLFSARDYRRLGTLLLGAAAALGLEALREQALALLDQLAKNVGSGLFELRIKQAKGAALKAWIDNYAEKQHQMRQALEQAKDRETITDLLENLLLVAELLPRSNLPIFGVRALSGKLGKKPVLGSRRAVLIEGVEHFQTEGANAFLKTLEEPPRGTVFLLTSVRPRSILPTIRSRCALVPVQTMNSGDLQRVLEQRYGLPPGSQPAGGRDLESCLRILSGREKQVQELVVRLFDYLNQAEPEHTLFDFLREVADQGLVPDVLCYLQDLLGEAVTGRELGRPGEALLLHLVESYPVAFLRDMLEELGTTLLRMETANLLARTALAGVFMGFYLQQAVPVA